MGLTGTITSSLNIQHVIDDYCSQVTDAIVSGTTLLPSTTITFTDGTAAGQVNKCFRDYRTLAATTAETLDLSGSLTSMHGGDTVVFTGIKYIFFAIISPDGTKKIIWGNAASNSFQGPISASGTMDVLYSVGIPNFSASGWGVANTSTDSLKIYNPGADSIDYIIILLGK